MSNDQQSLRKGLEALILSDIQIAGNESLLSDVFAKVSSNVKTGVEWTGGKMADAAVQALKQANTSILQQLGARKLLLSNLASRTRNDGIKDSSTLTSSQVRKLTTLEGNDKVTPDNIEDDLVTLHNVISDVLKFQLELETYYQKELGLLKSFSSVKNTEEAVKSIQALDQLTFPTPKFTIKQDSMFLTSVLAGGKQFAFNPDTCKFTVEQADLKSISGDATVSFAKEDVLSLLTKVNALVIDYNAVTKANEHYMSYIKEFNTVVGRSFVHLEEIKGQISISLIRDMQSRLEGNPKVFSFYSGFLPKITLYIDDYVEALTSFLSKQFN